MINLIIDARMVSEELHGIARYTYELIKNLCSYKDLNLSLLVNDESEARNIFKEVDNVNYINMKSKFLSIKEQLELPRVLNKFGKDYIFHSPSFTSSPFLKIKSIMTIHDLNHLRYPQFYSPFHKYFYKYIVKPSALKSERLITVSNFSKNELVDWLKCDKKKVEVTYNGIDKKFKVVTNGELIKKIREKYNLPESFVLYVGNQKPHKNVETLIKAMSEVKGDIKLVINGKRNETIEKLMSEFNLTDRIQFIGFIEDDDLPILYNMARVFVFPSLYEGFGLPPLEAMACGCPAIVSNTSSLPEVVGEAAIKINPLDYKNLGKEIESLITDEDKFKKMSQRGRDQITKFNWKDTAGKTYEIYKEVGNG